MHLRSIYCPLIYCPLYGVAGCPLWRGSECIRKSVEKQSGPESFSVILQVSVDEGCLLSGVPLY